MNATGMSLMEDQLTIAVDFDGVIADYEGWQGEAVFGQPRTDVIEALEVLRAEGWKIVVYSSRPAELVRPYLIDNCIPFDEINQNSSHQTGGVKPIATVYWDDRACCYSGDALKDLEVIRNFRTWSFRVLALRHSERFLPPISGGGCNYTEGRDTFPRLLLCAFDP
jgi:hypothetical protein